MSEDYKVAIKLTLINDISKGLLLASSQFKVLQKQADAFSLKLKEIKAMAFAGAGLIGGGLALAAPFIYATSKAAELQKQMLGIQIATVGTTKQMESMRGVIERASSRTMFSAVQTADMAKIIATSNSFNAGQVSAILPEYAKFADVQLLLKGTDYKTSVLEAVRLAHTANIYTPEKMSKYLDTLTKASIMSGGNISELGTALKYSQGTAQSALGISPDKMILVTALANRMGFSGSRGGTNLIDAMIRTMPGIFGSGLLEGKSNMALLHMGMIDKHGHSEVFKNGKFDIPTWMEKMYTYAQSEFKKFPEAIARQHILTNEQHAYGAQGRRIATLFSTPQALQQYLIMMQQFQKLSGNSDIQNMYVKNSVAQQYQTAITNFQNAMIELGTNLLPMATRILNAFNAQLNIFIPWMRAHHEEVKRLTYAFLGLAGSLAIGGTIALLTAALTALVSPVGILIAGFALMAKPLKTIVDVIKYFMGGGNKSNEPFMQQVKDYYSDPKNQTHVGFLPTKHSIASEIHNHYYVVDGKPLADHVTKIQSKQANRQPSHGSLFNPNISLQPNMLNYGGSL